MSHDEGASDIPKDEPRTATPFAKLQAASRAAGKAAQDEYLRAIWREMLTDGPFVPKKL